MSGANGTAAPKLLQELQARQPLRPGVEVTIGGRAYLAPALNFVSLKRLLPKVGAAEDLPSEGGMSGFAKDFILKSEVALEVIVASLERNYPGITLEMVEEELGMEEMVPLLAKVVDIFQLSGVPLATPGDTPQGEASAGSSGATSTGS